MLVSKRITVGNVNLLRFMFPSYDLITSDNIPEDITRPVIYRGDLSLVDNIIKKCEENHVDYIVVGFYSDINLDDRRILANIVFEKWRNGVLPKYLDNIIDDIDMSDFLEAIKIKWVTGKWTILKLDDKNNFLQLIEELNKSTFDFMKTYFSVIKENRPYKIESSMLTFLQRAKDKKYDVKSFDYRKKLDTFKGKRLENCLDAVNKSLEYNIDNPELRLLNLFMNIKDNGKVS